MLEIPYEKWSVKAEQIARGQIADWKKCAEVTDMLEHVQFKHGQKILQLCHEKGLPWDLIQSYADMCDAIGSASRHEFQLENGRKLLASSTCLRYLWHAVCILEFDPTEHLVEIGGGYGGLAVAIDTVSKFKNKSIKSYSILDLENVQKLQKFYVSQFDLSFPVHFPREIDFPCTVISNYAIAELDADPRSLYMERIIKPLAQKAFFVWNTRASWEELRHTFSISVESEVPQTGSLNTILRLTRIP